jgi:hypothetical protein
MYDYKLSFKEKVLGTGIVGKNDYQAGSESKVRVVVENALFINTIEVRARVHLQSDFITIETFQGQGSFTVDISTYDYIQVYCSNFAPDGDCFIIVSSFN